MNKKIINKLNKIIALSKNNGNEGDTALIMAEKIMNEYGITHEQLEECRMEDEFGDMGCTCLKSKSIRPKPWETTLAYTIARHFGCISVLEKKCNADTNFKFRFSLKFVGHESNRLTSEILYEWLHKIFMAEAKKLHKSNKYLQDSYLYGASYALYEKYKNDMEDVSSKSNSLVVLSAVERYVNETMDVKNSKSRKHDVSADSFYEGKKLGKSISLNRQCYSSEGLKLLA